MFDLRGGVGMLPHAESRRHRPSDLSPLLEECDSVSFAVLEFSNITKIAGGRAGKEDRSAATRNQLQCGSDARGIEIDERTLLRRHVALSPRKPALGP